MLLNRSIISKTVYASANSESDLYDPPANAESGRLTKVDISFPETDISNNKSSHQADSGQNMLFVNRPALAESNVLSGEWFEVSASGLALIDTTGLLLDVNSAFCSMLGYGKDALLNRNLSEFCHPDEKITPDRRINRLFEEEDNKYVFISRYLHQDGTCLWCEEHMTILYDESGEAVSCLLQWHDKTSQKQLESQLQVQGNERNVLVQEVHHRVRNNLQIVSSLLSLQSRFAHRSTTQEMNSNCQMRIRSIALVHELLYHSDSFSDIDLNEFITELFRNLKNANYRTARDIDLRIHMENVTLNLNMAIPIGLILNELLSNTTLHAFPFLRPGDCIVEIHLRQIEQNTIELCVCDNGVGFLRDSESERHESLGLYLVTMLVEEQLDGRIQFCTNRGSQVIIQFEKKTYHRPNLS